MASCDAFCNALAACDGKVVIDLSRIAFLGSVGIAVVVSQRKRLRDTGGTLELRSPNDIARRVFEAAGLSDWLDDSPRHAGHQHRAEEHHIGIATELLGKFAYLGPRIVREFEQNP